MPDDNRMYFIRNAEALKNYNKETMSNEFEVLTDAPILGDCKYGPYYFSIWEFILDQNKSKSGYKRKLLLRIVENPELFKNPKAIDKNSKGSSFYHGGGITDEIIALTSLFLRRKLWLGRIVRMNDEPKMFPKSAKWIDSEIIENPAGLSKLPKWLDLVTKLEEKYHLRFILATRLYHQGLIQIEEYPELSYLNLISAIEVLSGDQNVGNVELSKFAPEIASLLDKIEDKDLAKKIENAILKKEGFIGRRFVSFILAYTKKDFWKEHKGPEHGKIKPSELEELLKRIYQQRSKLLHEGIPFPPPIYSPPIADSEISPKLSITKAGRKWNKKEFIPNIHFFERLVNHVLKNFLKSHAI